MSVIVADVAGGTVVGVAADIVVVVDVVKWFNNFDLR